MIRGVLHEEPVPRFGRAQAVLGPPGAPTPRRGSPPPCPSRTAPPPHGFGAPETCRATNPSRRVPNRRGVSRAERTGNGSSSRFSGSDAGRRERSSAWTIPPVDIRSSRRSRAGPGRYASLTSGSVPDDDAVEKFSVRSSLGPRKRQPPSAPLKARISRHTSSRSSSKASPRAQIRVIRGTAEIGKSREGNPAPFGEPPGTGSPCPSTPPRK